MILRQALDSFLKYLKANRGFSELTLREYRYDLLLFFRYLENTKETNQDKLDVKDISKYDVGNFLADLILENSNSPVTRNRRLFSLRSFFKYLLLLEVIETDPSKHLVASKTLSNSEPIYLQLAEARTFVEAIKKYGGKTMERDAYIMKMFLYCGLRVGELVSMDLADLDLYDNHEITVIGKGKKERRIPLHPELIEQAEEYFSWRQNIKIRNPADQQALFLSIQGKRISVRTIQLFVKKYAQAAGLPNSSLITPHKLRHTFATLLYKESKDIRVLQDLLGHESISTTQIYTHTDAEQRRKIVTKMPKI